MLNLAGVGLVYDAIGVIILGKALALANDSTLNAQSNSISGFGFTFSPGFLKALVEQQLDARMGLTYLLVGFLLQLLATMKIELGLQIDAALVVAACSFAAAFFLFFRRVACERDLRKLGQRPKSSKGKAELTSKSIDSGEG